MAALLDSLSAGFGGDVVTRPDSRDAPHLFGAGCPVGDVYLVRDTWLKFKLFPLFNMDGNLREVVARAEGGPNPPSQQRVGVSKLRQPENACQPPPFTIAAQTGTMPAPNPANAR